MQGVEQTTVRVPLVTTRSASPVSEQAGMRRQSRFRLAVGWLTLALWVVGAFALDWDAEWHSRVGRDGFWTPPHLVFYTTIAVTGVMCAGVALLETFLYHRHYPGYNDRTTTPVLGYFHGPVGFMLAGFGMAVMLASAPLDDYWHRIYGIDVKVWAPFHVMLLLGINLASLGFVYLFGSEVARRRAQANLAPATSLSQQIWQEVRGLFHPATLGLILATTLLITRYLFLLGPDTFVRGTLSVFGLALPAYSLVIAGLPLVLVALANVTGRFGAATLAGLLLLLFRLLDAPLINAGINYLVTDQGRSTRPGQIDDVTWNWIYPVFLALAGLAVDLIYLLTRHWREVNNGRNRQILVAVGASAAGALIIYLLDKPWEGFNNLIRQAMGTTANQAIVNRQLFSPDYWAALPVVLIIAAIVGVVGWGMSLSLRYNDR